MSIFLRTMNENDPCAPPDRRSLRTDKQTLAREQALAAQAKALSHPARIRILSTLCALDASGGCLNSDLVGELDLAQSTVSEHIRVLRQAGFIRAEPTPPRVCYRVNRDVLDQFTQLFDAVFEGRSVD